MSHKPNPFDFVPFDDSGPNLYPLKEFVESGETLTGYLTVRIKALTPVHIVGEQDAVESEPLSPSEKEKGKKNYTIIESRFFRINGTASIPSSTIRGCLHSFLEAATNGWVSQFTPYYEKKQRNRKHGFKVDKNAQVKNKFLFDKHIPPALNENYILPREGSDMIDIPSFLFGLTPEEGTAMKGRVVIENAKIDTNESLDNREGYRKVPDITASAFMGGPKPSASSWWYQYPHQIRLSKFKDRKGKSQMGVDFIGAGYRGRKFYFHQDPLECVKLYTVPQNGWPRNNYHPLYSIPIECLKPGSITNEFRLYFEELSEPLLKLLILALTPGSPETEKRKPTLRHKLGYGKAYGYGSIEYMITGGKIREQRGSTGNAYIEKLQKEVLSSLWNFDNLDKIGIGNLLHKKNLEALAKILWFDSSEKILFQYPPFGDGGFWPAITKDELLAILDDVSEQRLLDEKTIGVSRVTGKNLAQILYQKGGRKALHFKVYQENADNYQKITGRNLYLCK